MDMHRHSLLTVDRADHEACVEYIRSFLLERPFCLGDVVLRAAPWERGRFRVLHTYAGASEGDLRVADLKWSLEALQIGATQEMGGETFREAIRLYCEAGWWMVLDSGMIGPEDVIEKVEMIPTADDGHVYCVSGPVSAELASEMVCLAGTAWGMLGLLFRATPKQASPLFDTDIVGQVERLCIHAFDGDACLLWEAGA